MNSSKQVAVTDYSFADLSIERSILEHAGIEVFSFKEKRRAEEIARLISAVDDVIAQFAPLNSTVTIDIERIDALTNPVVAG